MVVAGRQRNINDVINDSISRQKDIYSKLSIREKVDRFFELSEKTKVESLQKNIIENRIKILKANIQEKVENYKTNNNEEYFKISKSIDEKEKEIEEKKDGCDPSIGKLIKEVKQLNRIALKKLKEYEENLSETKQIKEEEKELGVNSNQEHIKERL